VRVLLPLLLSGCLSAEKFDIRWSEERCTLMSECEALDLYGHSSMEDCLIETTPVADDCPDYDADIAQDCLDRVTKMGCKALLNDSFPEACDQVCGTAD
jgi:hypothetical protein